MSNQKLFKASYTKKTKINLQSVIKYFSKVKQTKENWTRPQNCDTCFCVSFDHYCQKLFFGGETGH